MHHDPVDVLARLGGAARVGDLVDLSGRSALRRAVSAGAIRRIGRGRYALPEAPDARRSSVRLSGVLSHESAAAVWRIDLPCADDRSHVTVARHRRHLDPGPAVVHWSNLAPTDVIDGVTSPLRTVLDLARGRPLATGLAAADSALRQQLVLPGDLTSQAAGVRGPGARAARLVAASADPGAESVLESALRAIVIEAGIRGFEVQLQIDEDGCRARVDLGDPRRRIVLEADSFAHHGHRAALERDCRRYTELTIRGWRVLRFAWEHVMFEPEWVAACIRTACC